MKLKTIKETLPAMALAETAEEKLNILKTYYKNNVVDIQQEIKMYPRSEYATPETLKLFKDLELFSEGVVYGLSLLEENL